MRRGVPRVLLDLASGRGASRGANGRAPQALTIEGVEETAGDGPQDKAALPPDDVLAQAAARIAELERIIGQQQVIIATP
ncbi:hypothetical protein QO011_007886 [Labrys wisconsinensis]|uniref:Uncharacterized protein n=1 Tax=Labrys wisconsinensis TaxID=425677 RepID=A0ABU0JKN7_9HYPH|nr:hypothetical protein [Labrys wisconsinensis]